MPISLALDGAYYKDGVLVFSGQHDPGRGLDAALLLTAVRLACESDDPYFSLDPINGAAWLNEGKNATAALWARIKENFKSRPNPHATRKTKSVLEIRTVSARRDYPALWASLSPSYPNLKSKLVFKPEWLAKTRFGEVLYKADILLKELAYGVPLLQQGELRASKIDGYATAGYRNAANGLLAQLEGTVPAVPEWRGSRLWFDLTSERVSPSSNPIPYQIRPFELAPLPYAIGRLETPRERRQRERTERRGTPAATAKHKNDSTGRDSELRNLLRAHHLIDNISGQPVPTVALKKDENTLDLSEVYPHMFIRRHDSASGQDIPGHDPALDDLATDVNRRIDRYVSTYAELRVLTDLFRAYVVAVQMTKDAPLLCRRVQAMPILDSERVAMPLPAQHPSELFLTLGSYEFTDGNFRRLVGMTGQSINGGVSIGGRSLYATAIEIGPTLVTQAIVKALALRTVRAEWDANDRRFIAFDVESGMPEIKIERAMLDVKRVNSTLVAQSPTANAEHVNAVALIFLGVFCAYWLFYMATKFSLNQGSKAQKVSSAKAYVPDKAGCYPNGAWAMPDLTTRSLRENKKEESPVNPKATAQSIATERDKFFCVNDVSDKAIEKTGDPIVLGPGRVVSRAEVISGRVKIVEALNGELWPIEAEDVEPVDHNVTHLDNRDGQREHREHILMVSRKTAALAVEPQQVVLGEAEAADGRV